MDSSDEIANRLTHVVFDASEVSDCRAWLIEQMREGTGSAALLSELLDTGWDPHQAEDLIEYARRQICNGSSVLAARNRVAAPHSKNRKHLFFHVDVPGERTLTAGLGAAIALAIIMVGKVVESLIGRRNREIRDRLKRGLCYHCGCDTRFSDVTCPSCNKPIIRRTI